MERRLDPRQSEIAQLHLVEVGLHKHVARFDVSMNNLALMKIPKPTETKKVELNEKICKVVLAKYFLVTNLKVNSQDFIAKYLLFTNFKTKFARISLRNIY